MTLETFLALAHFDTILSALLAILSLLYFQRRERHIRLMGLLQIAVFVCNLCSFLLAGFRNIPASIYEFILIVIVSVIYYERSGSRYPLTFRVIVVVFFIVGMTNLFFIQKESITSFNKLLSSFIIVSYSVFYFYRLMVELPTSQVHRLPMFWFNSAFLIYHAGTIFLFAFTPYLVNVLKDNLLIYWSFHNSLSIIQHLIILIGLIYDLRTHRHVPAS